MNVSDGGMNMDLIYPEHKHPHGINDLTPQEWRIWVCEECGHIFSDEAIRKDAESGWGHACKSHPCRKGQRCESHLEPYMPDMKVGIDWISALSRQQERS